MTSKSKKDKIKQGNQKDFDLLYDILVSGGTYSDYKSELLDRSMPQELLNFDVSEDDILAAWILGKDDEMNQYKCGGHLKQDYQNSYLNVSDNRFGNFGNPLNYNINDGSSMNDGSESSISDAASLMGGMNGMNWMSSLAPVLGRTTGSIINKYDNIDDDYQLALGDAGADPIQRLIGNIGGTALDDAKAKLDYERMTNDAYANFGIGDTASNWLQYLTFTNSVGPKKQEIASKDWGSRIADNFNAFGQGALYGGSVGEGWGALIGGIAGGLANIGSQFLEEGNREKLNNEILKYNIGIDQGYKKFDTNLTNSYKMQLWNQLQQPYLNTYSNGGKMKNKLASGGYINSHYDYITDPLVKVNAGGTHQENPNEGVQTSVAPDGQPNLVEEGETIINNGQDDAYVFSDRIVADDEILKSHLLPNKFAGKTYADISKELDKIIEEHKNDEISKRTFDEMISRLQQAQEDLKFQEKQLEVEKFLDTLSDEQKEQLEQTMVEEAQAEQQAAEEQAIAELQAQELAAQEQQIQPEQAPEQVVMEQPEEQIVPSRYDQMMSRALFADAANLGMFGLGGHLHQDEISWMKRNYIDNYGMRRDANTGNLFFDPLVRQTIISDDPRIAEMAKETNDNYIQAGLMGLDMASAINAANLAAKSSGAASALNKTSTASKIFSKEADKAIRGFIRGKNSVSPLTLINASVNQANKASNLRNTAGNIYDLYTSANQTRNIIGGANSVIQPLVTTYGLSRNTPVSQGSENIVNEDVVYDYSDLMPWYTFDNYQEIPTKKPSVKNLIEYEYSGIPGITNEIQGYSGLLRTNKQNENSSIKTSPSSYKGGVLNYVQDKNSNITIGRWTSSGKYKPGTTYSGLNKEDKASFDEYYKNSQLVPELEPIGLSTPEEAFDMLEPRSFGNASSSTSTVTTDSGNDNTNNTRNVDRYTTDYSTWLRYAPAVGSGIQYLSDLFGVTNRNDYTNANMFQRRINDIPNVGFVPLGNYMTYSPLDETYQQNVARSQYNAARRAAINNASGNAGAALAAINSISGNMNNTFGDLALQAREYNDKQRDAVEQFNANIARINSMMSLSALEKNQAIAAEKARLTYNLANMRENIQNMNDAAKSANENTFYNNLGAIGKENFNMQMVRTNPAFYYTIMSDGSIVYKNGFYDLNRGDLDFITADAEKAQKEQLKKNSEDALKKSEESKDKEEPVWFNRYYGRNYLNPYIGNSYLMPLNFNTRIGG